MILGIDLGTTNSACAVFRDGAPQLVPNALGDVLTPSAVCVGTDGEVAVGLAAREAQSVHPDRAATSFKRYMGTDRVIRLGGRPFKAEDLSALVLRALKADAERMLGAPVDEAVITVPAYFNDKQRRATRRAGELAGFKVRRLINEPTAAALAHGLQDRERDTRFLVFDLGGGTFDVSVLEMFDGVIEVRASAGDNALGGNDFNLALARLAAARLGIKAEEMAVDPLLHEKALWAAERCRRALSNASGPAPFRLVWKGEELAAAIEAEAFEAAVEPLLDRLRRPIKQALRDGNLNLEAIDEIVMIGGATRMPVVRKAVTRLFGRFPAAGINPDEAVALGAAIQAGLLARDSALEEVVLTDVCPFSLGTETAVEQPGGGFRAGVFTPIIERNTVIPASREKVFVPSHPQQTQITIKVFQGESRNVADNVKLGELDAPLPANHKGQAGIRVRFSYDASGLLEVDVEIEGADTRRQMVIYDAQSMNPEELAERRAKLAALKTHPRDSAEARAVLARAERCFEEALGDERVHVGALAAAFEAALDGQERRDIEAAKAALVAFLDHLEGRSFL